MSEGPTPGPVSVAIRAGQSDGRRGGDLFIVDNSDSEWKVLQYLREWSEFARQFDIATGYFEIGALLALDGAWQKVDKLRILMGDEVSQRTKRALIAHLKDRVKEVLDSSLERSKRTDDFLQGVPAIESAIRRGQIECRVYAKDKFHAKACITHARQAVVGSVALVGSSNLTYPGLTKNVELNVQIKSEVEQLQAWYERHWLEAEEVSDEVLRVLQRHTREYTPFEVYARSLSELFRGSELTSTTWERDQSRIYKILAPYQREGYHALLKRAQRWRGTFLCDGVGLGKTYVGLMLIERLIVHDRLNVALFVPKAARESVWERALKQRLPHLFGKYTQLAVFNHTDLLRGGDVAADLESVKERAHVIIVDEAHHFRNTGTKGDPDDPQSRYWKLFELAEGKTLFLLTATPVNNHLRDLQHMIELFSRRQPDYFRDAPLGLHSLPGHFRRMENALDRIVRAQQNGNDADSEEVQTNLAEAERVLGADELFRTLVVQRSRAYVKRSTSLEDGPDILFPKPREPQVVPYSVKQTYGKLLRMVEEAFSKEKPLFSLAVYQPLAYLKASDDTVDPLLKGRQRQVVSLIRVGFLKRFESSAEAFRMSCWSLLRKLLAWVTKHAETSTENRVVERWKRQHAELIQYVQDHQQELFGGEEEESAEEDIVTPEMLEAVEKLSRDDYRVGDIIDETILDLDQLAVFLTELEQFKASQDKKLAALLKLLRSDRVLKTNKVLIFSEFMDTARYLRNQLRAEGLEGVYEIDSGTRGDRATIIQRFSPYYNGSSSSDLASRGLEEIRILVSTDVLAEGLNLQDATRLINYDLHWNPVRLMQRIGRVDRRMDPTIEARIVEDHPEQATLRGDVAYWNFLPPDELNDLLRLYQTVSRKTLKISKTFGIEGKKLLRPEDDYDALKDFTEAYEGTLTPIEEMHLELQALLKADPELEGRLAALPGRVFSGRQHPKPGTRAVFLCYALPAQLRGEAVEAEVGTGDWSIEGGLVQWYLFDMESEKIMEDPTEIVTYVRSTPDTPRHCTVPQPTLSEVREKVDRHVTNSYLKKVQAPVGVSAELRAWMELN